MERRPKGEKPPKRSAQEWCDIGNDRLAGRIPYSDGKFEVRRGLKWVVENKQPRLITIGDFDLSD